MSTITFPKCMGVEQTGLLNLKYAILCSTAYMGLIKKMKAFRVKVTYYIIKTTS